MTNEELVAAIQAGNKDLMDQLWKQCYGFIKLQAARFLHRWDGSNHFELEDLTQQCYFGLCEACRTFMPGQASFCSWLNWYLKKSFREVAGCRTAAQCREPLNNAGSLDEPLKDGSSGETGDTTILDFVCDSYCGDVAVNDEVFQTQCSKILHDKISKLSERQQVALEMKFFGDATDQAIADKLNISRACANVYVNKGLRALRKHDIDNTLRNLLDDMYYEERNLYNNTGLGFYISSGMSSPEYEAIRKEKVQRMRKKKEDEAFIALVMERLEVDRATAEALIAQKTA